MMNSKRELTPSELNKLSLQKQFRVETNDSPDTVFTKSVRRHLIQQNMFQSLADGTREETVLERRTALTPTETPPPTSGAPTSPLAS